MFLKNVVFLWLFQPPKIIYCLTKDEYVLLKNNKTSKSFTGLNRLLEKSPYFEMLKGKNLYAKIPLGWKKGFGSGIVIPKRARYCRV